jgi:glycolate oxidase FAD binding subunit
MRRNSRVFATEDAGLPMIDRFAQRVRDAVARRQPLCLRGGGSKDFYGRAPEGEVLDTRGHAGIVAYEPTELVITARGGTPLAEIEATLAERGQLLAFEPPHFGEATLGGCVAAGLSGPRRASAGALRDFVLGVKIMDGRARVLSFGGQVMKNVAGYDVSRLMAGSLGTLGLILEVSLKVLPRPVAETTLLLEMPLGRALETMNRWAGRPLPISATYWHKDELMVRLSGARAAVAAAQTQIGGETFSEGDEFWGAVREQRLAFFRDAAPVWRLSLPSTASALDLPGSQVVEWGGSQRWLKSDADADVVFAAARAAGGHAVRFRGGDRQAEVFAPLAAPQLAIHRELKGSFDPEGIFNRGRLYAAL